MIAERPTLLDYLEYAADQGDAQGVHFIRRSGRDQFRSYRDILDGALGVAGGLRALGVGASDRIGVAVPTGPGFYDAYFGAMLAGAVPASLPLPRRFGPTDDYVRTTSAMLDAIDARVVLCDARNVSVLGQVTTELGSIVLDDLPREGSAGPRPGTDDLAVIQFSSGTTGSPKAVALTHAQVIANVRAILGAFLDVYPERDGFLLRGVSWLPLYHDMGLVGTLFTALVRPGPLALMAPELFVARPVRWLEAISHYKGTVSPAPHFAYAMCVDRIKDEELTGIDLSSWRLALDGAETVTPRTLERFVKRFAAYGFREEALSPVYGLAEAGLAVTFSDLDRTFKTSTYEGRSVVSAGRPIDGFQVCIEGHGPVGRVLAKGPSIMTGYLGDDAATARVLKGEWLDTGDEGFLKDGELYLTGRDRDKIVLRGGNYAPEMFEEALEGVDGVRPGGALAASIVTDRGEELVILVEWNGEPESDEGAELRRTVSATLSERTGFTPERVVLVEAGALPRTSSGKLRRSEAIRRFATEWTED